MSLNPLELKSLDNHAENVYEAIVVLSKRARQINEEMKIRLNQELEMFATRIDSEEEIEEEHRLFYVAVTRAKKRLFLSLHHQGFRGGITQFHKVSRFIDTPEVRERLQLHMMMEQRQPFVEAAEGEGQIGLDKGGLLKKITDYFRKERDD